MFHFKVNKARYAVILHTCCVHILVWTDRRWGYNQVRYSLPLK